MLLDPHSTLMWFSLVITILLDLDPTLVYSCNNNTIRLVREN